MVTRDLIFRILFAGVFLSVVTYNSITNFAITNDDPECILDKTHLLFDYFYLFFQKNNNSKKFLLILIGVIMDISIILTSIAWIKYGKSWRPLIIFLMYISIVTFSKFIFKVKIPEGHLMQDPGVPSLTISYNTDLNIFCPSSIGLSLYTAMELGNVQKSNKIFRLFSWISYFNLFLQIFVYMSLRSIYMIDVFCPIVSLLYSNVMSESLCNYFDRRYNILCDEAYESNKNFEKNVSERIDKINEFPKEESCKNEKFDDLKTNIDTMLFKADDLKSIKKESKIPIKMANLSCDDKNI